MAVVAESVEDGTGQGGVVIEGGGPLCGHFVCGEDDGVALVAGADDLEEEVAALLVQGEIAELIELCVAQHNSIYVEFPKMWSGRNAFRV